MAGVDKQEVLLEAITSNSRVNLSTLSRTTGIPNSTLYATLKKMEKNIIKKHYSSIDFKKIGLKQAILIASPASKAARAISYFHEYVNNLYRAQEAIIAEIIYEEEPQLKFMERILSNQKIKCSMHEIMSEVKKESAKIAITGKL